MEDIKYLDELIKANIKEVNILKTTLQSIIVQLAQITITGLSIEEKITKTLLDHDVVINLKTNTEGMQHCLTGLKGKINTMELELSKQGVVQESLKKIVFGAVGFILLAFLSAIVALVILR